jgi:hypothetical protein
LLRALGTKNDARYNLKIVDVDRPMGAAPQQDQPAAVAPQDDYTMQPLPEESKPVQKSTDKTVDERESATERTRKELADLDDLDI